MNFSPSERRAIITLLLLCVGLHFIPDVVRYVFPPGYARTDSAAIWMLRSLSTVAEIPDTIYKNPSTIPQEIRYFKFNPNQIDVETWGRLGISEQKAGVIVRYVEKGGRFFKPEDLHKIYVLKAEEITPLLPYVEIPKVTNTYTTRQIPKKEYQSGARTHRQMEIELNTADSAELVALPGIGPILSARILRFRDKLGGFHSVTQLKEVYGLKDSVYQTLVSMLKVDTVLIQKININSATTEVLGKHPYIGFKNARMIIRYRETQGRFEVFSDLRKIMGLTEQTLQKAAPYVEF